MPKILFEAMPSEDAEAIWAGSRDVYGLVPETFVSDGDGVPCRHCLKHVERGEPYLLFAYRPFPILQPYAETGPIFLHAKACSRFAGKDALPPIFATSPDYIVRGYGAEDRIVYGTGAVIETGRIKASAEALLQRDDIAYLHVRSARNNCYQCRVVRAPE